MIDPIQRALDSLSDESSVDWPALEAESTDPATRATLHALRDISAIAKAHCVPTPFLPHALPFTWGPLEVRDYISRGAHGDVYRAWDARLEREVALKLLRPQSSSGHDASFAIAEGRLLARVRHPNVVVVHGADRIGGQDGIWMELVDGGTLRETVALGGPLPLEDVIRIGVDVCSGLAAIHAAGLVHRDVKAQNVVRDRGGRTILMDLGAGKDDAEPDDRLQGTPVYLAPELLGGGTATVLSDIYAVGVLLFYLVTGRYPLTAGSIDELRQRHSDGEPERLAGGDLPPAFAATVDRALSRNPGDRFRSAGEMRAALEAAAPRRDTRRWFPAAVTASGVMVLLLGGIALSVAWRNRDGLPPPKLGPDTKGPEANIRMRPDQPAPLAPVSTAVTPPVALEPTPPILPSPPPTSTGGTPTPLRTIQERLAIACQMECRPSPDGRYVARNRGSNMIFWDVATGASRVVTNNPDTDGVADSPSISPRNQYIAYVTQTPHGDALRVTEIATGRTREVLPAAGDLLDTFGWTEDGDRILCRIQHRDGSWTIALVGLANSDVDAFAKLDRRPGAPSISGDGRFVVFDMQTDLRRPQRDIYIAGRSDVTPRLLAAGSSHDFHPLWTPDGSRVFFVSDRGGPTGGWAVDVRNGQAIGEPRLIVKEFGGAGPIAFAQDGALFYHRDVNDIDVYTTTVDWQNPAATSPARRVSDTLVGRHSLPAWSPDGRSLAYLTKLSQGVHAVVIQDIASGAERRVAMPFEVSGGYANPPRWSPDGRSITFRGSDAVNRRGYFRLDLETASATPVVLFDSVRDESPWGEFAWSPDGQEFIYHHRPRGIVRRTISTGAETVLLEGQFWAFRLSPDGASIAVAAMRDGVQTLLAGPLGGPVRAIFRAPAATPIEVQGWTPDGLNVIFTTFRPKVDPVEHPHRVWTVPAAGGDAVDTGMTIPAYTQAHRLAISPDGARIAYTRFASRVAGEVWVMRHFLPR